VTRTAWKKHWDRNTITSASSASQVKITHYTCIHILKQFSDLPPWTCYLLLVVQILRTKGYSKDKATGLQAKLRLQAAHCTVTVKTTFGLKDHVDAGTQKCIVQRKCYIFLCPHHKLASVWHKCNPRIFNSWGFIQWETFKLSAHKMITKPISQNIWRNVLESQR